MEDWLRDTTPSLVREHGLRSITIPELASRCHAVSRRHGGLPASTLGSPQFSSLAPLKRPTRLQQGTRQPRLTRTSPVGCPPRPYGYTFSVYHQSPRLGDLGGSSPLPGSLSLVVHHWAYHLLLVATHCSTFELSNSYNFKLHVSGIFKLLHLFITGLVTGGHHAKTLWENHGPCDGPKLVIIGQHGRLTSTTRSAFCS